MGLYASENVFKKIEWKLKHDRDYIGDETALVLHRGCAFFSHLSAKCVP